MTREEINAFGDQIKALYLDGDGAVMTMIGVDAPSPDCPVPSMLAVIRGTVANGDERGFTGNAVSLEDAICIARGKLRDARERHLKSLEEAKAKK